MDTSSPFKTTSRVSLQGQTVPGARLNVLQGRGNDVPHPPDVRLTEAEALRFIENGVCSFPVPLGIATNFIIDGRETLVAMATEERSVIAAASHAAKLCRETGGFRARIVDSNVATGQILYSDTLSDDPLVLAERINERADRLAINLAADADPMQKYGGGIIPHTVVAKTVQPRGRKMQLIVNFSVNTVDAMGANVVTRIGETLAKRLELVINARRTAVICSNRADGTTVVAIAAWPIATIGERVVERILDLQGWAEEDEDRATTHNKGVMNGVSAVAQATGQDLRAVEATAHKWASRLFSVRDGQKETRFPLLTQYKIIDGTLGGAASLSIPLGTVGGATSHRTAKWSRQLMGVTNVRDLASICAAAGLASNFAALRALADEGILASHARLREH